MSHDLTPDQQTQLRQMSLLSESEVAIFEGDLIVAKNVVTHTRRILGKRTEILNESTRRILKD